MLSRVKFISRDEVLEENLDRKRKKSNTEKDRRKKKKKWYSSDEYSTSGSSGSESDSEVEQDRRKSRRKKKSKSKRKKRESSEAGFGDMSTSRSKKDEKSSGNSRRGDNGVGCDYSSNDDGDSPSLGEGEIVRREMGLEWMLRPAQKADTNSTLISEEQQKETPAEEIKRVNPKEMNPYLKDNGTGYPEEGEERKIGGAQLLSTSLVGDGGASWRLKALKRAREQAVREGKRFEEVVEERWGSLGKLTLSAASDTAAHSRAHLRAIKNRREGLSEKDDSENRHPSYEKASGRNYLRDVSLHHPEMRAPKNSSLSWGKRKGQERRNEDAALISEAASSLNKFANDGNFMKAILAKQRPESVGSIETFTDSKSSVEQKTASLGVSKHDEGAFQGKETLSANQLAAKALQLRMKGRHAEAQKLMEESERMKARQAAGDDSLREHDVKTTTRYAIQDVSARRRAEDDNSDRHLAKSILQNKKYSLSSQVEDEYDYGVAPSKKSKKKQLPNRDHCNISERDNRVKRVLTQQERCLFCFENPNHPKHLVVSIANFTYLMLPQRQPVVPGHCCILPMQHDAATRSVDDNVWEEIRNFKKCLIMMFAKQGKDLVFLETVMGLSQQRRHCLIECIPLPQEIAKESPLYFKKAIDEAEDEWSQHNAKKLIDTSVKGLRNSIPKNFPYFHVEFGLNRGFVHVIDDETQFNSSLGLNVIRGMLQLPEEDMYRRRRYEAVETQKQAVASFAREWEHFDWTKQLD